MKDNKVVRENKNFFTGKGFYIVLAITIIAVAIAALIGVNSTVDKLEKENNSYVPPKTQPVEEKEWDVPKENTTLDKDLPQQQVSLNFIVPISGDVITPFSGDNMIKSETLNEWVMHTGVDIKAEEGVKVKAIGNGEVVDVFNDSMWGTCVIIKHNESIESHYCNLKSATTVKKGQKVNCGDVIGEVGKTAEIESAMVSHLHFAVKSDGNYINPLSIIK